MSNAARFWDKRAEKYAVRPVYDQHTYEKKLEMTRAYFRQDSEVLEMGCGTGSTALAHASHIRHILATDISPEMIRIARAKAADGGVDNVTFEARAVAGHDIKPSFYDVIMAHNLLHLLEEPKAAMVAAHRGLKPGGVYVTSTACVGDMSWYFRMMVLVGHVFKLFPPVQVFTHTQLKQEMIEVGFQIEKEWLPKKNAAVFIIASKR